MIKRLQHKIVLIITLLLSIAVVGLMLAINIMSQGQSNMRVRETLEKASFEDFLTERSYDRISELSDRLLLRFKLDYQNGIMRVDGNMDFSNLNKEVMLTLINKAISSGQDFGYIDNIAFYVRPTYDGNMVVFTDASAEIHQNNNLLLTTSIIGLASVILFFLLSIALSFWLIRPVKETFDKQKRFISDASHELKTPLAVISANTDVLETEIGENKWLGYIRSESIRMSELVNELLYLARIDDKSGKMLNMAEIDLTDLVLTTALPFESRMFEEGKKFDVDAEENISCHGDISAIRHVLTILIDNAIKYSEDKGEIRVRLYRHGTKKIISVYNTGIGIKKEKLDKVFERFYREDEARNSKSGGYGLGLAIASEVVERHHGTIKCESEYGKWVKFTVTLP